jgi:hypothetical protein
MRTLFALALFVLVQLRAEAVPILSAPIVTAQPGETVTIPISITDAKDLQFFQFDLSFAPSVVAADPAGARAGADLPVDWFFASPGIVDNAGGHIFGVAAFGSPFSGSGEIAEIDFTALTFGVSPLTFSNVFLNLSAEGFLTVSGAIIVAPVVNTTNEPTMLALLAFALFVLYRHTQRRGS